MRARTGHRYDVLRFPLDKLLTAFLGRALYGYRPFILSRKHQHSYALGTKATRVLTNACLRLITGIPDFSTLNEECHEQRCIYAMQLLPIKNPGSAEVRNVVYRRPLAVWKNWSMFARKNIVWISDGNGSLIITITVRPSSGFRKGICGHRFSLKFF